MSSEPKSNKIALSFDVEDWYHTPMIIGSSFAKFQTTEEFFSQWEGDYDTITEATLRLLNILDDFHLKATFFVVADIVSSYPTLVRELKKSGHEIACHGLHHYSTLHSKTKRILYSEETFQKELIQAKKIMEDFFEQDIIGYRAPNAYLGAWMIDILEKEGFRYDSSIAFNSLYNKTDKPLRNIPSSPYYIDRHTLEPGGPENKFIELPWSYYRLGRNYILPGGGAYFFRLLGLSYFRKVLTQCLSVGDTMFYLHPLDISTFPIPMQNFMARPLYWVNKGERTEKRLIALLKEFKEKMTTCKEVYSRYLQYQV